MTHEPNGQSAFWRQRLPAALSVAGIAALAMTGNPAGSATPTATDSRASAAANGSEEWAPVVEYGEFLAAPEELANVPVNDIVRSVRMNAQAMQLGEAVYEVHCADCHGADLKGKDERHTPDLTDDHWQFAGDDLESAGRTRLPSDVEWTVRYGVRSGHRSARGNEFGMLAYDPAYRGPQDQEDFGGQVFLTPQEIADMVEYVLQLGGQPHDTRRAARAEPLFQDNAKGGCFDCHGRTGKGIAAFGSTDLTRPELYLYGSDRAAILESIRQGRRSRMPGFEQTLKPEALKAVSVFVFAQASTPPPAPGLASHESSRPPD